MYSENVLQLRPAQGRLWGATGPRPAAHRSKKGKTLQDIFDGSADLAGETSKDFDDMSESGKEKYNEENSTPTSVTEKEHTHKTSEIAHNSITPQTSSKVKPVLQVNVDHGYVFFPTVLWCLIPTSDALGCRE